MSLNPSKRRSSTTTEPATAQSADDWQLVRDYIEELRHFGEDCASAADREFDRQSPQTGVPLVSQSTLYLMVADRLEGMLPSG
jgi:hypothetical protein